jgi:PIN domain nuclease of toxin-antitoxin system
MKLLLDTHLLLWAAGTSDRLPASARKLLDDPQNEPIFSSASLWEVAIKHGLGRADFRVDARLLLRRGLLDNGYGELPITSEHAAALDNLPSIHPSMHKGPVRPDPDRPVDGRGHHPADRRSTACAVSRTEPKGVRGSYACRGPQIGKFVGGHHSEIAASRPGSSGGRSGRDDAGSRSDRSRSDKATLAGGLG